MPESQSWDKSEGFATMKRIARARGFVFDKSLTTEAYGELLGGCVEAAANYLNRTGRLRKKTTIIPELTNSAVGDTPIDMNKHKRRMKKVTRGLSTLNRRTNTWQ